MPQALLASVESEVSIIYVKIVPENVLSVSLSYVINSRVRALVYLLGISSPINRVIQDKVGSTMVVSTLLLQAVDTSILLPLLRTAG
jgi:hypothetical protein